MEVFFEWFRKYTPAQIAGKKAARAWISIVTHTDEEVETLTGMTLYLHAQAEARKWLLSVYSDEARFWLIEERKYPEQKQHEQYLEYLEAFISTFPPEKIETKGVPKY